jgi:hypothetical protein
LPSLTTAADCDTTLADHDITVNADSGCRSMLPGLLQKNTGFRYKAPLLRVTDFHSQIFAFARHESHPGFLDRDCKFFNGSGNGSKENESSFAHNDHLSDLNVLKRETGSTDFHLIEDSVAHSEVKCTGSKISPLCL